MNQFKELLEEVPARIKLRLSPYTYARVSAMKSKLIGKDEYQKLLKMELGSVIRYLQDTEYKQSIDEYGAKLRGVDLVERALNENLATTLTKLRNIARDRLRVVIDGYITRWDIHNLKTLLRGKLNNASAEEIKSLLVAAGPLNMEVYEELLMIESMEELVKSIPLLAEAKDAVESLLSVNNLIEVENYLDQHYFTQIIRLAESLPNEGKLFAEFLRCEIDLVNIKTLLRLKREGLEKGEIKKHIFFSGEHLDEAILNRLLDAKDLSTLFDLLKRTPYKEAIKDNEESFIELELELDKLWLMKSKLASHKNPLSILTILDYMLTKEMEVKNLKVIARAKELGLEEEFVEKKLIVVA